MRRTFLFLFSFLMIAFCMGCDTKLKHLKIAATPIPHAELLELIKPELETQGIYLKIVEVDDYNLPNRLLFEKQVDANFFQHRPFLEEQNQKFGYNLKVLTAVHLEPLGIYSQKIKALDQIPEGAIMAIPSDPTNEARALALLQEVQLIKLKVNPSESLSTIYDIEENPKHLRVQEVDAAFLTRVLPDVDLAIIPANFALQGHLNPIQDALALENFDSPYANIIAIREGDEQREDIQKLKKAMTSDKMRQYILEKYNSCITPAFNSCKSNR